MAGSSTEVLESISQVLWRAFILGYVVLLIWFVAYALPGSPLCSIHDTFFGLSPHECSLLTYGGMGLFKIAILVCFLIPWVAIRWALRKRRAI
jgi:hypothetical protein